MPVAIYRSAAGASATRVTLQKISEEALEEVGNALIGVERLYRAGGWRGPIPRLPLS